MICSFRDSTDNLKVFQRLSVLDTGSGQLGITVRRVALVSRKPRIQGKRLLAYEAHMLVWRLLVRPLMCCEIIPSSDSPPLAVTFPAGVPKVLKYLSEAGMTGQCGRTYGYSRKGWRNWRTMCILTARLNLLSLRIRQVLKADLIRARYRFFVLHPFESFEENLGAELGTEIRMMNFATVLGDVE